MESLKVIKHGDVFQYVLLCLTSSLVVLPLHLFLLQAAKEALNDRVIPQGQAARSQQSPLRLMLPLNP